MEDIRKEQKEALQTLMEFNEKLVKNMNIIIKELTGNRLDDTDNFLQGIVDAINWEVQVVNGTIDMLNGGKERINKEEFNSGIVKLADAIGKKDDGAIAEALNKLIPQFEKLGLSAAEVTA